MKSFGRFAIFNLFVLICQGSLDDDILAKFKQNQYKLKDTRVQVKNYNKDIYNFYEIKTYKFNRTVAATNLTCKLKVDMDGKKMEILVQVYKFASNEYRHFPIRFQVNAWKVYLANVGGFSDSLKCGNLTRAENFNFKKGEIYHVCNVVIDDALLPPLMPVGKYMVEATIMFNNQMIAIIDGFSEVYFPFIIKE